VLATTDIVITFSEPMNVVATQAAFQSSSLGSVVMMWNDDETELTVNPNDDLEYATGNDLNAVQPLEYGFSIGTAASDKAGNPLAAAVTSTFFTLRQITTELQNDAARTGALGGDGVLTTGAGGDPVAGDHADNLQRKGFLSFSLADLPSSIVSVASATVSARQYLTLGDPFAASPTGLGALHINHVAFSALDINAFSAVPLLQIGIFSDNATDGTRTMDVTDAVAGDLEETRSHSQFRLEFLQPTNNNGATDRARFDLPSLALSIVYLVE
jgi:hypothetical protein